jgi:hypothetical protein
MRRKIMIVLIAIAAIGAVAMPAGVSARGGHGSGHGSGHGVGRGGFHGFHGGFGYRSFGYPYYTGGYGYSCWRYWGGRRVWVCGGSYPYY